MPPRLTARPSTTIVEPALVSVISASASVIDSGSKSWPPNCAEGDVDPAAALELAAVDDRRVRRVGERGGGDGEREDLGLGLVERRRRCR